MALPFCTRAVGIVELVPSACRICEKSPRFSASVGTLMKVGDRLGCSSFSQAKNQNSLSLPLNTLGMPHRTARRDAVLVVVRHAGCPGPCDC